MSGGRIYLSPPDVRSLERQLILDAIDSNWIAPVGPDLDAFEEEVARVTGVAHAVGVTSGTAALHLALHEIGVGPGDDVLVATLSFAACANAVHYTGAQPVFVDSDRDTWTLSVELTREELEARAESGRLPKAAIVVDLFGQCADYGRLLPLFDAYGVPVIEDAAEALGATYRGHPAGSFGHCAVVSFNGNKIVTASGGGMYLCRDPVPAARVRHLATQAREPVVHYEHTEVGFNYRLSNLLAAFGRGQLAALGDRIERRRQVNVAYREALADVPGVSFMPIADYGIPNHWLTCIMIEEKMAGTTRERVRQHLECEDIEARPAWKPLHLQPAFSDAPRRVDGTSEAIFDSGLCLPSGSGMTDEQLERVIVNLRKAFPGS
jgi:dTDP-4-amino-4,6-dideoxygalactose transaminase